MCVDRKEIESYLEKRGISYCTDETNLDIRYTRNRIRQKILPYLEQYINRESVQHMARTMEEMTGVKAYVEREVERYAGECVSEVSGGVMLKEEAYRQVPEELRNYVLQLVLCRIAGRKKDLQAVHIEALAELFDRQTGRMLHLPYGRSRGSYIMCECLSTVRKRKHFRKKYTRSGLIMI